MISSIISASQESDKAKTEMRRLCARTCKSAAQGGAYATGAFSTAVVTPAVTTVFSEAYIKAARAVLSTMSGNATDDNAYFVSEKGMHFFSACACCLCMAATAACCCKKAAAHFKQATMSDAELKALMKKNSEMKRD